MGSPVEDTGAKQVRLITKSDTAELPLGACRALWIGGAGDVAVIAEDDTSAVTVSGVAAGTVVPIKCKKVMSTNTTATLIVALYSIAGLFVAMPAAVIVLGVAS
jgi:hypothetical protein